MPGKLAAYDNSSANMNAASYDGDGLRQASTITPAGGTASTQNYVWDTEGALPQLLMDGTNAYIYNSGTAPAEQVNLVTGAVTYLVADSLGSVRGIVNGSGTLTATTSYDAWGNPETSGGLTATTPFGYAGGYTDADGLVYLLARYYSPSTGQFISVDPALAQTQQPYGYASGNPVSHTDPTGQWDYAFCAYTSWQNRNRNCYLLMDESTVHALKHAYAYGTAFGTICWAVTAGLGAVFCGLLSGFSALVYAWVDENDYGYGETLTLYEFRYVVTWWWFGEHHWDSWWIPYWFRLSPGWL